MQINKALNHPAVSLGVAFLAGVGLLVGGGCSHHVAVIAGCCVPGALLVVVPVAAAAKKIFEYRHYSTDRLKDLFNPKPTGFDEVDEIE